MDASYFTHCTSGFVPSDAHVVLIEVANNLFDGDSASSLRRLLSTIRAVAPSAAIVFVNWLRNLDGAGAIIEKVVVSTSSIQGIS